MKQAGYGCVGSGIGGSAVTGEKYTTKAPFDEGRTSDYDVIIADPKLLQKAKDLGIGTRGAGTRTVPLSVDDLKKLGLQDLAKKLKKIAGRKVAFMIYNSLVNAASRAPAVVFFENVCT